MIENPPTTALVSGTGPSVIVPSVATMLDPWRRSPPPKIHTPTALASRTTARADSPLPASLVGNVVHRAVVEQDQVPGIALLLFRTAVTDPLLMLRAHHLRFRCAAE